MIWAQALDALPRVVLKWYRGWNLKTAIHCTPGYISCRTRLDDLKLRILMESAGYSSAGLRLISEDVRGLY
jgi:hypothetical protein